MLLLTRPHRKAGGLATLRSIRTLFCPQSGKRGSVAMTAAGSHSFLTTHLDKIYDGNNLRRLRA
jgi:hypothetical protein